MIVFKAKSCAAIAIKKTKYEVRNMKSELAKLSYLLENEYGSSESGHWEITAASKEDDCWLLTVKSSDKNEGAKNESN